MNSLTKLKQVKLAVEEVWHRRQVALDCSKNAIQPEVLIVTKNRNKEEFQTLIDVGHRLFGENKVQEAQAKWQDKQNCKLHLLGNLQTNKVKEALQLFDVIETLDRPKLADKIADVQHDLSINKEFYIQVNIGNEPQKSGVPYNEAAKFIEYCIKQKKLLVTGLMCIPPKNEPAFAYFYRLKEIAKQFNLPKLSMGMSSDFEEAVRCGSTQVRIGSAIFA